MKLVLGEYIGETITINLTQSGGDDEDLIGINITIIDTGTSETLFSTIWSGAKITTIIPVAIQYKIYVDNIIGYITPDPIISIAKAGGKRDITLLYGEILGVYIETTDNYLFTSSQWTSVIGKTVNAVVIVSEDKGLRLPLIESSSMAIDPEETSRLYETKLTESESLLYGKGLENTTKMLTFYNDSNHAARYCTNYTFPNGNKSCFLGSLNELLFVYLNITNINNCLSSCRGTSLYVGSDGGSAMANYYLTSTIWGEVYYGSRCFYCVHMYNGNYSAHRNAGGGASSTHRVKPISYFN